MSLHPDDRPDPAEQPIRARVPDRVAGGCFSTGVIVMTAQTEFVLDFVQNLGRPHQIVARVVMPHSVLPQLVDALGRNMQLYRGRWGELPQPQSGPLTQFGPAMKSDSPSHAGSGGKENSTAQPEPSTPPGAPLSGDSSIPPVSLPPSTAPTAPNPAISDQSRSEANPTSPSENPPVTGQPASQNPSLHSPGAGHGFRQATAQEIYDDLKIRDELLSGVYANAVMIGHGPHEFSFDFITNFYPNSAVSARVFLAAGQIPRLYESLKGTWEQLRQRMQPPPESPPPGWVV